MLHPPWYLVCTCELLASARLPQLQRAAGALPRALSLSHGSSQQSIPNNTLLGPKPEPGHTFTPPSRRTHMTDSQSQS